MLSELREQLCTAFSFLLTLFFFNIIVVRLALGFGLLSSTSKLLLWRSVDFLCEQKQWLMIFAYCSLLKYAVVWVWGEVYWLHGISLSSFAVNCRDHRGSNKSNTLIPYTDLTLSKDFLQSICTPGTSRLLIKMFAKVIYILLKLFVALVIQCQTNLICSILMIKLLNMETNSSLLSP